MHIHLANYTITLSLDDCHDLLAAEEALTRHTPDTGVPEARFFWQLCRHAHELVIESRGRLTEIAVTGDGPRVDLPSRRPGT